MVKIRLKRMGAAKRPSYRLVVADSRSPRDGRFIEAVGFYDPLPNPARVQVDEARVREWLRRGARPSDSARWLLESQGILPRSARPVPNDTRPAGAGEIAAPAAEPASEAGEPEPAAEGAGPSGDAASAETAAEEPAAEGADA